MSIPKTKASKDLTPLRRAEIALGVSTPKTDIEKELKATKVKRAQLIACILTSTRPEAIAMVEKYELLSPAEQRVVTVDLLMAAAKVDHSAAFSILAEELHRRGASISGIMMAVAHPEVTKKTIEYAKRVDGVADRKLLHLSMNTTPVPKNTITHVDARGANMQKIQINASVPSLSEIVKLVDGVVGQ